MTTTVTPLTPDETATAIQSMRRRIGGLMWSLTRGIDRSELEASLYEAIPDGVDQAMTLGTWLAAAGLAEYLDGHGELFDRLDALPVVVETDKAYRTIEHRWGPMGCDPPETVGGMRVAIMWRSTNPLTLAPGAGSTYVADLWWSEDRGDDGSQFSLLVEGMLEGEVIR